MVTFIVKFRNIESQQLITETVERMTFPEAASWAYVRRNTIGLAWSIEEIRKNLM